MSASAAEFPLLDLLDELIVNILDRFSNKSLLQLRERSKAANKHASAALFRRDDKSDQLLKRKLLLVGTMNPESSHIPTASVLQYMRESFDIYDILAGDLFLLARDGKAVVLTEDFITELIDKCSISTDSYKLAPPLKSLGALIPLLSNTDIDRLCVALQSLNNGVPEKSELLRLLAWRLKREKIAATKKPSEESSEAIIQPLTVQQVVNSLPPVLLTEHVSDETVTKYIPVLQNLLCNQHPTLINPAITLLAKSRPRLTQNIATLFAVYPQGKLKHPSAAVRRATLEALRFQAGDLELTQRVELMPDIIDRLGDIDNVRTAAKQTLTCFIVNYSDQHYTGMLPHFFKVMKRQPDLSEAFDLLAHYYIQGKFDSSQLLDPDFQSSVLGKMLMLLVECWETTQRPSTNHSHVPTLASST